MQHEPVAEGGPLGFNPLFLHGGTGLGKTHLMHAIGQEYLARHPEPGSCTCQRKSSCSSSWPAMRAKDTFSFKQWLRSADVLMIDDVQFIAGKESTQEEFFHTMNELISAGRRLVISADRSPQDLDGIESRILSRLSWGLWLTSTRPTSNCGSTLSSRSSRRCRRLLSPMR